MDLIGSQSVGLGRMFYQLFMGSLGSFGGGQGMFAVVQREFVSTGLLPASLYSLSIALGQVSPGPLSVAVVGMGFILNGLMGAAIALLILAAPMSIIVLLSMSGRTGNLMKVFIQRSEAPLRWLVPALSLYVAWGLISDTRVDSIFLAIGIALVVAELALIFLTKIELSKLIIAGVFASAAIVVAQSVV